MFKKFATLMVVFVLLFSVSANAATTKSASKENANETASIETPGMTVASVKEDNKVSDLSKAYELWKNKGIKFVVRDSKGKFVTWNVGRLESWGAKSKWVVRDQKGKFLHNANGKIETWKNGKTRLVIRDPKGRMMTHIDISLTDQGTFYSTVVGLRKLQNKSFLNFVQGRVADILVIELKQNQLSKPRAMMTYLDKHYKDGGVENFKPVLKHILPTLNFMLSEQPTNERLIDLTEHVKEMLKKL